MDLFSRNGRNLSSNPGHGFEESAPLPLMQLWRQLMPEQALSKAKNWDVVWEVLYDTFLKENIFVQIASAEKP